MTPGFLFDILALPRFLFAWLSWWAGIAVVAGLILVAGSVRAALRLVLFLGAIGLGSFLAVSAWLADHPEITAGTVEAVETIGGIR